jgi:hypothetical protein
MVFLLSAGLVHAETPEDACKALMEPRGYLVAMLDTTDKAIQDDLKGKVYAASAKLEDILATLAKGPDAGKAKDFKPVWEGFRKTPGQRNNSGHLCRQEGGGQRPRHGDTDRTHEEDERSNALPMRFHGLSVVAHRHSAGFVYPTIG